MRSVISVLVQNVPGVLSHVAGLLAARGYNVDSLTVGETENPAFSRMTIVLDVETKELVSQVERQLEKLVTVVKTVNLSEVEHVERDLALIRVEAPKEKRTEILQLTQIFRGSIVDVGENATLIEISGKQSKIDAFIDALEPIGKIALARSGCIAMPRDRAVAELDADAE